MYGSLFCKLDHWVPSEAPVINQMLPVLTLSLILFAWERESISTPQTSPRRREDPYIVAKVLAHLGLHTKFSREWS